MRPKTYDLLLAALVQHGVQPHLHLPILNDVCGPKAVASAGKRGGAESLRWKALLAQLQYDRRTITSNRARWAPELVPLYEDYIALMDRTRERIEAKSMEYTMREVAQAAYRENQRRLRDKLPPIGSHGAQWQTWVSPKKRTEFCDAVAAVYATIERGKGNRWVPFQPTSFRREMKARTERVRHAIASVVRLVSCPTYPGHHVANTYYGALLLAATDMATKELNRRVAHHKTGLLNPFDHPIPVQWVHLCDATMRARLKAAHLNPAAVTPDGIERFYMPPDEIIRHDGGGHEPAVYEEIAPDLDTPDEDIER